MNNFISLVYVSIHVNETHSFFSLSSVISLLFLSPVICVSRRVLIAFVVRISLSFRFLKLSVC